MKAYSVVESYFDHCEEWQTIDSYHLKEESAKKRKDEIELKYKKENLDSNQYFVNIVPIYINED